jgi:predicted nucleic acid-binding protein
MTSSIAFALHQRDFACGNSPRHRALIAATAFAKDLTLATRNTKDFQAFGLSLIDPWTV